MRRPPKARADTSYEGLWHGGEARVPIGDFEMVARWIQWLHGRGLSGDTVRLYSYGVFRLFDFHGWPPPDRITEGDVSEFLRALGLRTKARVQYYRGIRSFFRFLAVRHLVAEDPTVELRLRRPWRSKPVALTEEELVRYFVAAAARHPRRAWTLMLCFSLGTRRMEVAQITREDIVGRRLHLRVCKYGKDRWIELNRYAVEALAELARWENGTVIGVRKEAVTAWAHQAAVDSGLLPKVRGRVAHVLRASFISHLLDQGVPLPVVRDLVGHESISATNEYAAVFDGARQRGVDELDFARRRGGESAA
jgi:site-specific recombinase XerD